MNHQSINRPCRFFQARLRSSLIAASVVVFALSYAVGAPGDLDSSFGNGGKVTTSIGSGNDQGQSVALQSDGKIVVGGSTHNGVDYGFLVARYNANGMLDSTFGSGGKVITPFAGGSGSLGGYVTIQSDGRIIIAGAGGLARYNPNGSLDTTFNNSGQVSTSLYARDIAKYSDGRIVVVGFASGNFAVARYNPDGSPDTTFNGTGKVSTSVTGGSDIPGGVSIQTDGKIVVSGYGSITSTDRTFATVRYNSNGTLDSNFGSGGIVVTDFGSGDDSAQTVELQSNGRILVSGFTGVSPRIMTLIRYTSSGSLDTSFNGSGIVTTLIGALSIGYDICVQNDGRIVVVGTTNSGSNIDIALFRYNSNGTLDTTFDGDGKVTTAIGSGSDLGMGIAIQSDGKLVVAGYTHNGSDYDIAVVRYLDENSLTPVVSGVTPNPVPGSNSRQNFVINGSNFDPNCTVTLRELDSGEVFPNRTKASQSSSSITLNPNFTTTAAAWSVEVINPGNQSSGQFGFNVVAPPSVPNVTSPTTATQVGAQTVTLAGTNFGTGSQVLLFSLDTGTAMTTPAVINPDGTLSFNHSFPSAGTWSAIVQGSNGQTAQPTRVNVNNDASSFRLTFPMMHESSSHFNPFNRAISSVFDHAMKSTYTAGVAIPPGSDPTYGVTTFAGEVMTTPGTGAITLKSGKKLYSFVKSGTVDVLQGYANYDGDTVAWYDGHDGYDYPGTTGQTPVYAAAAGQAKVDRTGSTAYGKVVTVTHDTTGYKTQYGHLDSIEDTLADGDQVVEGQLLGKVGATGTATGAHLHFTVKKDGTPIDPYGWAGAGADPYIKPSPALWRDESAHPIVAFPRAFATGAAATSTPLVVNLNVGSQSYSASVTTGGAWLSITGGTNGSGAATLTLSVAANTGSARTGQVTITPAAGGVRVISVAQEDVLASQNPTPAEVAAQVKVLGKKYQIPSNLLAAIAFKESDWLQFDGSGNPLTGPTGDIGIMQINVLTPAVAMDVQRVRTEWKYNMEIGCKVLRQKWASVAVDSISPWDDSADTDPAIVENWFYPTAWYNGGGTAAYTYVGVVWGYLKSPAAPISDYFAPISDLGDPRVLAGFPTTIYPKIPTPKLNLATASPAELAASGMFTLKTLKRADLVIHRWNWDANSAGLSAALGILANPPPPTGTESPINVTEAIGTEPTKLDYETWASGIDAGEEKGPLGDIDQDGVFNLVEFALAGDPTDATSTPAVTITRNGNQIEATCTVLKTTLGITVGLETSTTLATWNPVADTPVTLSESAVAKTIRWTLPSSLGANFLRISVTSQ